MTHDALRRVVITGLGVLAPNGIGKEAFWRANVAGRSGVRRITRFDASMLPTQIAGEVPDFHPEQAGLTAEECRFLDRGTQFAVAAANLALEDGGLRDSMSEEERDNTGVFIGTACASAEEGEKNWLLLTEYGTQPLANFAPGASVDAILMAFAPAAAIAMHHRLHGPCSVISTGCSAGGDAIGEAFRAIQEGRAGRMLAGGSDAAIYPITLNGFSVMRALSTRNDEPEKASRPYDVRRDGFVMAEGAGVLVLEERELALARHAHIYAEVLAFSSNSNAHHMTALPEDGAPLQQLIRQALTEAAITPVQLNYINSHGSSTPSNDPAETAAYKTVFGEQAYRIPISATKSMIGHAQGAASAIEAIVSALVLDQQIIPPTINLEQPEPGCDLDYVPHVARAASVNVALTHASGFGGVNSALILARPDWRDSYQAQRAPTWERE
ncbi:MAG TPA: beta-ketoacyl-[acyl-carrier-protein] synthase family protein [Ktedonobacteraceae bacterium]